MEIKNGVSAFQNYLNFSDDVIADETKQANEIASLRKKKDQTKRLYLLLKFIFSFAFCAVNELNRLRISEVIISTPLVVSLMAS